MGQGEIRDKQLLKKIMTNHLSKAQKEMTEHFSRYLTTEDKETFVLFKESLERVNSLSITLETILKGE